MVLQLRSIQHTLHCIQNAHAVFISTWLISWDTDLTGEEPNNKISVKWPQCVCVCVCFQAHKRVKVTKDHIIKSKSEVDADSSSTNKVQVKKALFCNVHPKVCNPNVQSGTQESCTQSLKHPVTNEKSLHSQSYIYTQTHNTPSFDNHTHIRLETWIVCHFIPR